MKPTANGREDSNVGEGKKQEAFDQLRAELHHAFAAPDAAYRPLTAAEMIARNRRRPS